MSKEKLIEKMARVSCSTCLAGGENCDYEPKPCEAAIKDAEALYNAGYRKSEWISVDERLPDVNGRFLVYAKRTHMEGILMVNYSPNYTYGESSLMGRSVWFLYDSEWGDYEIEGVTHWMSLPEAPKMKGGEE